MDFSILKFILFPCITSLLFAWKSTFLGCLLSFLDIFFSSYCEFLHGTAITDIQLPPGFSLDEETYKYFFSMSKFKEEVNPPLNDGQGSHSLPSDSLAGSMSIAGSVQCDLYCGMFKKLHNYKFSSMLSTGQQFPSQQVRLSTPHAKATEEKEKGSAMVKPVSEVHKVGRRLVRPHLERSEEPQVDIEMSGIKGSTTEERKVGTSHEPEISGDISLQHPSSARKRLASSSASDLREQFVARDETGCDVAPPLKKSKNSDIQEGNEAQVVPSSSENPDTVQQSFLSTDICDAQLPVEDMESDQAPVLLSEDIVETAREDDTTTKEEIEEHQRITLHGTNQEDDFQYEGDAIVEEVADKSKAPVKLLDECLKNEDGKEMLQFLAADGEDEREEGESVLFEAERQQEDGTSFECQHEFVPGDGDQNRDETLEVVEVASPAVVSEKSGSVDVMEEVAEGIDHTDCGASNIVQSPLTSAGMSEGSPSTSA
ncbi:putative nuclear-pore anchor-like [Cocos nucifera]|uniref:Putative nuclear-pore anchor-like n=1 Tax=Cocos nucifera TaxID=13894 RepID=A0A8K0MUX0_COCNU|nr:putative nuclear-pore anchor-like [Cocos nucifera]